MPSNEYDVLIRQIRRNRRWVTALTILAELIVLGVCSPIRFTVLDQTIVDYKGIHPVLTGLFVLVILFLGVMAYAMVSSPLVTAMDTECDPQKHLILNTALNKKKNLDFVYAVDLLYMGRFEDARQYADKIVNEQKSSTLCAGLFYKALCAFFLEDLSSLEDTAKRYEAALSDGQKSGKRARRVYESLQNAIALMLAIAKRDEEKIKACLRVETWNNAKTTRGLVDYLKGVGAYCLGDEKEAVYRLMAAKESCSKTVLATLADGYLEKIN